jgi:hypothetical protein
VLQRVCSAKEESVMKIIYTLIFSCLFFSSPLLSQDGEQIAAITDTTTTKTKTKVADTTKKVKPFSPKIAATRSAILPGWGQAYNKKYWKIPIVYGALGTAAGVFIFNIKNYKDLRFAYTAKYKASLQPPLRDSTDYFKIKPNLLPLSLESLRFNRDQFRRNVDYSVLVFILLWGLNVVDAAVDAHLKSFDVSPDLSLQINTGRSEMAGTNGVSLILKIGK